MRKIYFSLICLIISYQSIAQDSLLRSISDSLSAAPGTQYVTGTFKALYIVNMKTIEAPAAGALNFEIQHRFGTINEGAYHLWGLDFATLRLGLDYGISDRLSVGIGRSSVLETFDGYVKYKLLRQTENPGSTSIRSVARDHQLLYRENNQPKTRQCLQECISFSVYGTNTDCKEIQQQAFITINTDFHPLQPGRFCHRP